MDSIVLVNRKLSRTLAYMVKQTEKKIQRNNSCIQSLRDTIIVSDRHNLQFLKAYLIEFTQREEERDFNNTLIELYVQFIEQKLRNKS